MEHHANDAANLLDTALIVKFSMKVDSFKTPLTYGAQQLEDTHYCRD